jgi:hypothetical protein
MVMISEEKDEREGNEETMIETLREMMTKIKTEIEGERAKRDQAEEHLIRLMDEALSKLSTAATLPL